MPHALRRRAPRAAQPVPKIVPAATVGNSVEANRLRDGLYLFNDIITSDFFIAALVSGYAHYRSTPTRIVQICLCTIRTPILLHYPWMLTTGYVQFSTHLHAWVRLVGAVTIYSVLREEFAT